MGMALFESSGIFRPSAYGLSPGDMLHITVVGGGGGGSLANNAGNAGEPSSFGSILTAAGGSPGSIEYVPVIQVVAGRNNPIRGYWYGYTDTTGNDVRISVGSQGADGWLPGRPFKTTPSYPHRFFIHDIPNTAYFSQSNQMVTGAMPLTDEHIWNIAGYERTQTLRKALSAAQSVPMAGYGSAYSTSNTSKGHLEIHLGGAGGIGYGAGGGGDYGYTSSYALNGGYSGVKADIDYVLPSIADIPITVGNGGNGYESSGSTGAGGGSRGCVAIWW
nr:MAG TPA: hypothetical protein [Caudoviricetes sp.]